MNESETEKLSVAIMQMFLVQEHISRCAARKGPLNSLEQFALAFIEIEGGTVPMAVIGRMFNISSKSTLTEIAKSLCDEGFTTSSDNPSDSRQKTLELTDAGKAEAKRHRLLMEQRYVTNWFPLEHRKILEETLSKKAQNEYFAWTKA